MGVVGKNQGGLKPQQEGGEGEGRVGAEEKGGWEWVELKVCWRQNKANSVSSINKKEKHDSAGNRTLEPMPG